MFIRSILRVFLPTLFALVVLVGANVEAAWIYETINATGDAGQYGSIALDSEGTPHVAWFDASNNRLMYAYRDFALGWVQMTVDESETTGQWTSIAINPATDLPAIAYYANGPRDAMYAYFDGTTWQREQLDGNGSDYYGEYIDLAFTSTGMPYVMYHIYMDDILEDNSARVAWRTGASTWSHEDLQTSINFFGERIGVHSSITMDSLDYPHMAYAYDWGITDSQVYAWKDGSGWHHEDAWGLEDASDYADIALDGDDNVYISYYAYSILSDECASLLTYKLGEWTKDNITCSDSDDNYGQYSSVAVGSDNTIYVTYYGDDSLKYAVFPQSADGKSWTVQTLDSAGDDTGRWTSIVLDDEDRPFISYYDYHAKDFKFVFDLPQPVVDYLDPDEGLNTGPVTDVIVYGDYFANTSNMFLQSSTDNKTEIACTNIDRVSENEFICDFDITGATPGQWHMRVTSPVGDQVTENVFTVTTLSPTLAALTPDDATNDDQNFAVTITGNYFTPNVDFALIKLGSDPIYPSDVIFNTTTEAEATFDLRDAATGSWNLGVSTEYGSSTLTNALQIDCGSPRANFTGLPRNGAAPHTVHFVDSSQTFNTCDISEWLWQFGDGETSDEQSPNHIYTDPGTYTVSLTVTTPGGDDTENKIAYITVSEGDDDDDTTDDDASDDDGSDDDNDDDDNDDDDNDSDDDNLDDDDDDNGPGPLPDDDTSDEMVVPVEEEEEDNGCGC